MTNADKTLTLAGTRPFPATHDERELPASRGLGRTAGHLAYFVRRHSIGAVCSLVLTAIIAAAAFAPWIAPHEPTEFLTVGPLAAPSGESWLGTDQLGRDLFTRILYGARTSLAIATVAVGIGLLAGAAIGLISGYVGGAYDTALQRVLEIVESMPSLVLAIVIVAMLGASSVNVTAAMAVVLVPQASRVARAVTLTQRQLPYIEAATALGAHPLRVQLKHIAPSLLGPLMIVGAAAFGAAIITESSLSFLGLGSPPPTPTWGQMLAGDARQYFVADPWLAIAPGAALALTVLCMSLLGDAVREVADPRLRRKH